MTTHFGTLAWKIPWIEEPGGLQSMGVSQSDMVEHTPSNNNLTKKVKAPYTENCKMLMKVIEDTDKKIFCLWIGRINNAELSLIANLYIENLVNEFSHLQTDISIDKNNFFPFWIAYVFLTLLLWLEL